MSDIARKRYVRGSLLVVLGFLLAVLTGVLVLAFVSCSPIAGTTGAGDGAGGADVGDASRSFTIAGNASKPTSPGVMAPLDLSFTNPNDTPMSVTDLRVTVRKVSAPNADAGHPCAVGDFAVNQAARGLKVTVATRATSTLSSLDLPHDQWPHVVMLQRSVNQDGCKGASLTLAYAASGTLDQ